VVAGAVVVDARSVVEARGAVDVGAGSVVEARGWVVRGGGVVVDAAVLGGRMVVRTSDVVGGWGTMASDAAAPMTTPAMTTQHAAEPVMIARTRLVLRVTTAIGNLREDRSNTLWRQPSGE
jgi:hypothetical protein